MFPGEQSARLFTGRRVSLGIPPSLGPCRDPQFLLELSKQDFSSFSCHPPTSGDSGRS